MSNSQAGCGPAVPGWRSMCNWTAPLPPRVDLFHQGGAPIPSCVGLGLEWGNSHEDEEGYGGE
jgi:hypothetical protein